MKEQHWRELGTITQNMDCPKLLQCYTTGLEILCKANDIGLQSLIECLEENPDMCPFSLSLPGIHLCKCQVRVYICKNIGK
jgi:hypothetical protein